ncbi:MAG: sulfurtransferase [Spirochaetia bacterium]
MHNHNLLIEIEDVNPNTQAKTDLGTDYMILDLRGESEYKEGHVPGAFHFPVNLLQDPNSDRGVLLPVPTLCERFTEAGIGNERLLILYDGSGLVPSAKMLWVLERLGRKNVGILNGGFIAWSTAGLATETAVRTATPETFSAHPTEAVIAQKHQVLSAIDQDDVVIVDARSADEFAGRLPTAARNGHIPGARNINWESHIKDLFDPTLQSPETLRSLYHEQGVTPDKEVIVYCRSGARSSHSYFVLRLLGYERVRNYSGSWLEWGNDPNTPIE